MKLEIVGLGKSFGPHRVLHELELSADFPHVLALIGPSGGGKSTLLRILGGLEAADTGTVLMDGRPLPGDPAGLLAHRRGIGTVFQAWNLFPHLTALENVLLPLRVVHRVPEAESLDRAMAILERLQLAAHARKHPAQLSGGQRQRTAIARAVAVQPRLLLFDEPTSALDPEMTAEVLEVIAGLKAEGRTIILATHEMGFAREVADVVAFVAEGRVPAVQPAHRFFDQPPEPAARFLSRVLKY